MAGALSNSWVRARGVAWEKNSAFSHKENMDILGPNLDFTREEEGGWLCIQLKAQIKQSYWVEAPEEWIKVNQAEISGGRPILIMKGFDLEFKDFKSLGEFFSEKIGLPVIYTGKEIDWK